MTFSALRRYFQFECILFLTGLSLLTAWPGHADTALQKAPVALQNPGFEIMQNQTIPSWQADSLVNAACSQDQSAAHGGRSSLLIEHFAPSQTTVYSQPVHLQVGKLYRLCGWIKTAAALTDGSCQYPTPVPACLRMESMPITAHSQAVGGDQEWSKIEILFFAARAQDRVCLHLGYQGDASGHAWFDDIEITAVDNIADYIPIERIQWYGPAFRFEEQGWIYLHIEGKPYARGFQYGNLVAQEIKTFINKLAINRNKDNPALSWRDLRTQVDMLFLRKYEDEFMQEMQGIADGAKKAGVLVFDHPIDLLDIVTINSYIDLSYGGDAITKTPHQLSGQRFQTPEDEMDMPERLHKCSGFLANHSATADQRIVFGQLFMWNGYMGPEWDVIVDLLPEKGNRLVYETFPGGIHSGADFYINSAGIMIGETTVGQTPFNPDGTPQSNRIRLAAQYAKSIDDVVKMLSTRNNGLYTNDWLIGDCKNDEIAIFLLGTNAAKLWRSSRREFYGDQADWYWSNNNAKSLDVRKEYIANADNAPYDLTFRPWDRDMVFWKFYERYHGKIDAGLGMRLVGSSPINRPHACDGKITTSEMAEKMMFMINYGKVTLREQFVNENGRIPDLPLAIPRLSLGYTSFSPLALAEMIGNLLRPEKPGPTKELKTEMTAALDSFCIYPPEKLWINTLYPASDRENWLISGTAAYWQMLNGLPKDPAKARSYLANELAELNCRLLYTQAREGTLVPLQARTVYDQTRHYHIPRIRGAYLLHQLRLALGNERFSRLMNGLHDQYARKNVTTETFVRLAEAAGGSGMRTLIEEWINRDDLPNLQAKCTVSKRDSLWNIQMAVEQSGTPYRLFSSVQIKTANQVIFKPVEIAQATQEWNWTVAEQPLEITLNSGNDFPVDQGKYYTFTNFYDNWEQTLIVYGTARQIEANHTLALRFARAAADRFTETILPVRKDCELNLAELKKHDVILLGGPQDNQWIRLVAERSGLKIQDGFFVWQEKTHAATNEGLAVVVPNPYNPERMVTIFASNSALQLYQMTKALPRFPSWALFKDDQITERGYHEFSRPMEIKSLPE